MIVRGEGGNIRCRVAETHLSIGPNINLLIVATKKKLQHESALRLINYLVSIKINIEREKMEYIQLHKCHTPLWLN